MSKSTLSAVILVLAIFTPQIGVAAKTKTAAASTICQLNLAGKGVAAVYGDKITQSAANRLLMVLDSIPDDKREAFLQSIDPTKLHKVAEAIQSGQVPPSVQAEMQANPGLGQFYIDLSQLTDTIPGILSFPSPQMAVLGFLKSVIEQEKVPGAATLSNGLLEAQREAPRLRWALFDTLENVIYTATNEYRGLGRQGFNYLMFRARRFFDPSFNEVRDTVEGTSILVHQGEKVKIIDAIGIQKLFSGNEKLNESERAKATSGILNSGGELKQIIGLAQKIFGPEFSPGHPIEKGKSNIDKIHNNLIDIDWEKEEDGFETLNIGTLDMFNGVWAESRRRQRLAEITVKDYLAKELPIYFEAFEKRIPRYSKWYLAFTAEDSNESYTITDRHWQDERKDDKGNVIEKGKYVYSTSTITPSFETMLDGSYRTGNYDTSGLNEIKARAARMVRRENEMRKKIADAETLFNEVREGYAEAVKSGQHRDKYMSEMQNWLPELDGAIAKQRNYAAWTDAQILAQYSEDNTANFRGRNENMLKRLENMRRAFEILGEMLRRPLEKLYLAYPEMPFDSMMQPLRRIRNINYTIKSVVVGTIVGTTFAYLGYDSNPEIRDHIDTWAPYVGEIFQNISHKIQSFQGSRY